MAQLKLIYIKHILIMAEIIISMTEVNHYSDDVLYDLHKFDYKCSLANLDINDVIYSDLM